MKKEKKTSKIHYRAAAQINRACLCWFVLGVIHGSDNKKSITEAIYEFCELNGEDLNEDKLQYYRVEVTTFRQKIREYEQQF